jgi:NAD(P)-dependent dehydrogenase (short-subunit alcohol dehydrogenase family)
VVFVASTAHAFFSRRHPTAEWVLDLHPSPAEYDPSLAYGKSKLANVLAAVELQRRYQKFGIRVVALHPGEVNTELFRHFSPALRRRTRWIFRFFLQKVSQGAQTSLYCALTPDLVPGGFYMSCRRMTPSAAAQDTRLARDVMALTDQIFESYT